MFLFCFSMQDNGLNKRRFNVVYLLFDKVFLYSLSAKICCINIFCGALICLIKLLKGFCN